MTDTIWTRPRTSAFAAGAGVGARSSLTVILGMLGRDVFRRDFLMSTSLDADRAVVVRGSSAGCARDEQAMRNVPRISIDEVKALMAKKQVVLVDVRDPQSFAEGHMPGAINVPFDHIPKSRRRLEEGHAPARHLLRLHQRNHRRPCGRRHERVRHHERQSIARRVERVGEAGRAGGEVTEES